MRQTGDFDSSSFAHWVSPTRPGTIETVIASAGAIDDYIEIAAAHNHKVFIVRTEAMRVDIPTPRASVYAPTPTSTTYIQVVIRL